MLIAPLIFLKITNLFCKISITLLTIKKLLVQMNSVQVEGTNKITGYDGTFRS